MACGSVLTLGTGSLALSPSATTAPSLQSGLSTSSRFLVREVRFPFKSYFSVHGTPEDVNRACHRIARNHYQPYEGRGHSEEHGTRRVGDGMDLGHASEMVKIMPKPRTPLGSMQLNVPMRLFESHLPVSSLPLAIWYDPSPSALPATNVLAKEEGSGGGGGGKAEGKRRRVGY